jgi:formylglycine-generating enzyme required for sulfatase activity
MTTIQRDALDLTGKDAARGLQIYNTCNGCAETWNGSKWIQAYPPGFLKPEMMDVQGNPSWSNNSKTVNIPSFKMSKTEVTQAQFEYVMGTNPSYFKCGNNDDNSYAKKGGPTSALPVEYVSWYDAITYCNKLSIREGRDICYTIDNGNVHLTTREDWEGSVTIPTSDNDDWNAVKCDFSKNGYRLPTDSEWEYAARGKNGADNYTYAGSNDICAVAWYFGNNNANTTCTNPGSGIHGTKPVAMKTANNLDLCDMSGNVFEWCWNWYNESGDFPKDTPTGKVQSSGGSDRVLRGGCWNYSESYCRVSNRNYAYPYTRNSGVGIRVVCKGE